VFEVAFEVIGGGRGPTRDCSEKPAIPNLIGERTCNEKPGDVERSGTAGRQLIRKKLICIRI
jgi:hypothetical protein